MTLDEIKQLIEFIKGHDLSEFELEQDGELRRGVFDIVLARGFA